MGETIRKIISRLCIGEAFTFGYKQCEHQISCLGGLRHSIGEYIPEAIFDLKRLGEEDDVGDRFPCSVVGLHAIATFKAPSTAQKVSSSIDTHCSICREALRITEGGCFATPNHSRMSHPFVCFSCVNLINQQYPKEPTYTTHQVVSF